MSSSSSSASAETIRSQSARYSTTSLVVINFGLGKTKDMVLPLVHITACADQLHLQNLVRRVDCKEHSIFTDPQATQIATREPLHIKVLSLSRCCGLDSRHDLDPTISGQPAQGLPRRRREDHLHRRP